MLESLYAPGSPARLYALLLRLRPLQQGTLMPFSGELVQAHSSPGCDLPLPQFVLQNLLRRWEDVAPPALAPVIQRERVESYLEQDGIIIIDYDLTAHHIHLTTHQLRGFVGACTYQLRGPDEQASSDSPLTVRQQLYLLALLAFYCGVGHKTTMGPGQVRLSACEGSPRSEYGRTRRAMS